MKNNIHIDPVVGEMLLVIEEVLKSLDINFYVVGAVARDLQFSRRPRLASLRKTKDVDLALADIQMFLWACLYPSGLTLPLSYFYPGR